MKSKSSQVRVAAAKSDVLSDLTAQPDNTSDLIDATPVEPVIPGDIAQLAGFAIKLGVELSGTRDERFDNAAQHLNRSVRHMLAAGVLLASIKAECKRGEFLPLLAEKGFNERAAQRAMLYAGFVLSRPEAEREALIGIKPSKVLALASADPEVVESLLAQGVERIDGLTFRALEDRIRELEAQATDLTTQRDTAEAEAEGWRKKAKRGLPKREDEIPHPVADLRAEVMALSKKAALTMASLQALGGDIAGLIGTDHHEWADATMRLALSAVLSLRVALDGICTSYLREVPGADPTPAKASYLSREEVIESARRFAELTQVHEYERLLREWEREQERPRGQGRPKAKPVAPQGAEE